MMKSSRGRERFVPICQMLFQLSMQLKMVKMKGGKWLMVASTQELSLVCVTPVRHQGPYKLPGCYIGSCSVSFEHRRRYWCIEVFHPLLSGQITDYQKCVE